MKSRILGLCLAVALASPAFAQQGTLTAARDLYASARYDEALAVLNGMPSNGGAADRRAIEQYRSLCLLALGRGSEAESAIAAVVTVDPAVRPGGIGRLAARARRLQRRAQAPAARDRQGAVRQRQSHLRSQGARGGGT